MTFEQFAYWLQGFAEIHGREPEAAEWCVIKEHLATCFNKVTSDKEGYIKYPFLNTPPSILDKWKIPPVTCKSADFNPLAERPTITC